MSYWRRTRAFTYGLLLIWVGVTFVVAFYAEALNNFVFFGFPLGFYMAAQGALLIYLILIGVYCLGMDRIAVRCGRDPQDD